MRSMLATVYAVTTVVLAACGSDSSTDPTPTPLADNSAVVGTWNLTTINGTALPYLVRESPKVEIVSDRFVLLADGTFTAQLAYRVTADGADLVQSKRDAGTYSFSGTVATFRFNDQTGGTGAVSGNTLTIGGASTPFVYLRE